MNDSHTLPILQSLATKFDVNTNLHPSVEAEKHKLVFGNCKSTTTGHDLQLSTSHTEYVWTSKEAQIISKTC